MTENMKLWLVEMYQREIEEAESAASNEHLWALGSDDGHAWQHEENASEQEEYIKLLKELIKSIEVDN